MKYCVTCGARNEDVDYCRVCGSAIGGAGKGRAAGGGKTRAPLIIAAAGLAVAMVVAGVVIVSSAAKKERASKVLAEEAVRERARARAEARAAAERTERRLAAAQRAAAAAKAPEAAAERPRPTRIIAGGEGSRVRGALDKEIIRRVIRRHLNEVKFCYQKGLAADPKLAGRVVIQFTVASTGQVVASMVQRSTLENPEVESCIAVAVRRWLFPAPNGGGIVIISYPFVLRAVE